jgi:dihydropteroate synthase
MCLEAVLICNARLIKINNIYSARKAVLDTGADGASLQWLAPKALHAVIKLEAVSSYAANILKQEMLGKGGDAAVHRGTVNCSVKSTDVLLMGSLSQYERLVGKLGQQSGELAGIAGKIHDVLSCFDSCVPGTLECRGRLFPVGKRTLVMGILNVTPDSFSDGGSYTDIESALKRVREMLSEGADIIDIGGESTRPGYSPVSPEVEIRRVVPVVQAVVRETDAVVSIDTTKSEVARKALDVGAHIINDVWGLQRDCHMADVIAGAEAGVVLMHNSVNTEYRDLMGDITKFLQKSIELATTAGISRGSIIIDPGIGFGKTIAQNLEVIRRLHELSVLQLPVLLGTSRKSVIGKVLDIPVEDRAFGTAATIACGIMNGADIIRVHDIREMVMTAVMTDAICDME